MKIIQTADHHIRHNLPFFKAGVALDNFILERLKAEEESFVYLDSGDRFHTSKETGRVNGEVVKFFSAVAEIEYCVSVLVMQGNHDVKEETGSALDAIQDLHSKIILADKPYMFFSKDNEIVYLLPYMRPFSEPGYSGVKSYGNEEFHRNFWKSRGFDWDAVKHSIKLVSMHGGDETAGKFFMNADISFLPGLRSNGHVHKQVSKNHLPSAAITRRDEADKKCVIRFIDTETWDMRDMEIPLFLNYAQIQYGDDIDAYFASGIHIMPKESLIVDIYGHDDRDLVIAEYTEKWADRRNPKIYVGEVTSVERKGAVIQIEERNELDIGSIDVKELFREFCEEKKLSKTIADDLAVRIA
jgi:hypothetical protein